MVNTKKTSRLAETSFSYNNLREAYISDSADYIATLRDEAMFSNWGLQVIVKVPVNEFGELNENNVDEYSNFVDLEWESTTETVIPKFTEYRQNVSEDGMSADGTDALYPLEVLIPTKLHLPRNSRLIFNEYNSREEKIVREWVVLGTIMKQLSDSKTYSRIARCVPARKETYQLADTNGGAFFFTSALTSSIMLEKCMFGTMGFNVIVNQTKIDVVTIIESIAEHIEDEFDQYEEELQVTEEIYEQIDTTEDTAYRYFAPYRIDSRFSAKKTAISVLY